MTKTLNTINTEHLEILKQLAETGELTPELEIKYDENKKEMAEKLDSYCYAYQYIQNRATLLSEAIKRAQSELKSLEKQGEYLLNKLDTTKDIHNLEANNFKFSYRKSTSIEVFDVDKLPPNLIRLKVEPDKTAIKEQLKNGPIEGVREIKKENLSFKLKI